MIIDDKEIEKMQKEELWFCEKCNKQVDEPPIMMFESNFRDGKHIRYCKCLDCMNKEIKEIEEWRKSRE